MCQKFSFRWKLGVLAVLLGAFLYPRYFAAQNPAAIQEQACLGTDAQRSRHPRTGQMRFVGTRRDRPIRHVRLQGATSPEAAVRSYLSVCGSLFGIQDQAVELKTTRSDTTNDRRSILRFQQTEGGFPVMGGELVVHLNDTRDILAVVGKTIQNQVIDTTRQVTANAAQQTAITVVARAYGENPVDLVTTTPELWIYDPAHLGPAAGPTALVWRMDVTSRRLSPIRELVLVDARRGSVILHFNQVEMIRNRLTHTADHSTTLPGTLVCSESGAVSPFGPCSAPPLDTHAAAAHTYAGDTYDYFFNNHGRNSLDNAGMTIVSTVHYSLNYSNAFWNGSQMVFGDAFEFPLADDVVAHELTHGVTQYTSNLFNYYQSGAIDESLSDLFGEFIDLTNGHGNDAPEVRWLIGEDVAGLGARRNMQNPPMFNHPDKMTSGLYHAFSISSNLWDNGGVHTNSGINNKAAYLMTDGGTFNGQTITGLGIPKVSKIYYEVNTHLLTSGADYADLYNALFQACNNLIGTAGITAADCQQVRNATLAVEMNLQPVTGSGTLEAPLCTGGLTPANIFFDDLETGVANWVFGAAIGPVRWFWTIGYSHSGTHSLWAFDSPAVSDTTAALANGVLLPANALLHFSHAFNFDHPNFDAGIVEYSTNGGSTWTDAGPLFDVNGYNGPEVFTGYSNPLAGRPAFVGDSRGYMSSRMNLSPLAGQTVRFRWRMGLDTQVSVLGWFVDDVRIYTCVKKRAGQVTSAD